MNRWAEFKGICADGYRQAQAKSDRGEAGWIFNRNAFEARLALVAMAFGASMSFWALAACGLWLLACACTAQICETITKSSRRT